MQTCKKWQSVQAALREIFLLLENLAAYVTINKMVITYIPNSGVPRKEKQDHQRVMVDPMLLIV